MEDHGGATHSNVVLWMTVRVISISHLLFYLFLSDFNFFYFIYLFSC